jgi:hypothetical protein
LVGRTRAHYQRNSFGIGHDVAFAAFFPAIGGVWPGVRPPFSARTEALSITARSRLIRPRLPRTRSSRSWSCGQTCNSVHSRNRRQHVLPLPQPISTGSICQGIPVRSMNMIPDRHARSSTRGRPPLLEGWCRGSKGSMHVHNAFETLSFAKVTSSVRTPYN